MEITEEYIGLSLVVTTKFPNHGAKLECQKTELMERMGQWQIVLNFYLLIFDAIYEKAVFSFSI